MSFADVVVALVKIAVMMGFFLTAAAVATWADRRQSAMIQDRVGPNRAVVYVPSFLVRLVVLLPPTLVGVFALAPAVPFFAAYRTLEVGGAREVLQLTSQAAVLIAWLSLLLLARSARARGASGDGSSTTPRRPVDKALARLEPRTVVTFGALAHLVVFLVAMATPTDAVISAARAVGVVCGVPAFGMGIHAASQVPEGDVPVRLAGILHAVADTLKMILKEDFIPPNADRLLHSLAPMLAVFPAIVTMAVIPFGATLCVGGDGSQPMTFADLRQVAPVMGHAFSCRGHAIPLQIADLNVGILYLFAMAGTGVIGAAIAGWASDNKFSLLGGLRAASQMVSYEVAMGLSLVGLFILYGSVRLGAMVDWQGENAWGIFVQPIGFVLFLAALAAETKRIPFDQPEGESEIVAGYFLEYSGFKWGMFMTGEYLELITSSALLVTLFFGGHRLPFLDHDGVRVAFGDTLLVDYKMNHLAVVIISVLTFFGKTVVMTWFQIFFRWTLPRFRYDQVMKLGWTRLLPLSLANMMVTGVAVVALNNAGPGTLAALSVAAALTQAAVVCGAVIGLGAIVVGMLEPRRPNPVVDSTASRFASAAGGTKATPQQA
jgi:NADH-quinone oxidoreductase subunit H